MSSQPVRQGEPYRVRHGQGYTVFEHVSHGVAAELLIFVPEREPVRIWRLRLRNLSGQRRRLSATAYVEWVLGVLPDVMRRFIVTEVDPATGALFARNAYNSEFAGRIAFAAGSRGNSSFVGEEGTGV